MLRCPVCRTPLARQGKSYRCPRGHSFDVARSGYVNLLRAGSGRSHGDHPGMLRSRREFLEAGYYQPLLDHLVGRLKFAASGAVEPGKLVDVGCGEGYFTGGVARELPESEVWGIDISRTAVDMAAKRHAEPRFVVAAARDLPIIDAQVDAVTSIFAPLEFGEYERILRPGGRLLAVGPGGEHLVELRRELYGDLRSPGRRSAVTVGPNWTVASLGELKYQLELPPDHRERLLHMTPYGRSGNEASRRAADLRTITVHFVVHEWTRSRV